jgi:hypothetical protein
MLPAAQGDCFWIEYGTDGETHRILFDGGPNTVATYAVLTDRVAELPAGDRHFDLIVVSHIDIDHIDGIVKLLDDDQLGVTYDDFWFNGYQHLKEQVETFGGRSGERLTGLIDHTKWNRAFGGEAVVARGGKAPCVALPGGMFLTVLSPTPAQLEALFPKWKKEAEAAGLNPELGAAPERDPVPDGWETFGSGTPNVESLVRTEYEPDDAEANGSSIALLARHGGKSVLLLADAFAEVVDATLDGLVGAGGQFDVDVVKVSHHGSPKNTPIDLVTWLVSASGAYHKHPNPVVVARIVKYAPRDAEIVFNYRNQITKRWDASGLKKSYHYRTRYPGKELAPVEVELG